MTELYAAWLAAPHKTATLQVVTEHFRDQLPAGTRLGKPCKKHGHTWNGTPWCLRRDNHCAACEVERIKLRNELERTDPERKARHRAHCRAYLQRNREQINARRRDRLAADPEQRQRRIEAKREARRLRGALPYDVLNVLWPAIRRAGRCPTVAHLVATYPEARRQYDARMARHRFQLKYLVDPELRRYHHEKSRRRKAHLRGNHVVRVTPSQVRRRFAQFDHACAYCGRTGDLQQEHFLPISRGGTHVLSNILPACLPCNYSKSDHDPEAWYKAQPCYTAARWRRIRRVLGLHRTPVQQLSLI